MPLSPCRHPRCPALVRSGYCAEHARVREQQRPYTEARKLYRTARWARLRETVRSEQPLCPQCLAEGRAVAWTDLDHIRPHRGDLARFFDRANLQGLCREHHSAKTIRGE